MTASPSRAGPEPRFAPLGFSDLPDWGRADHRPAFFAFRRSAPSLLASPGPAAAVKLPPAAFAPAARAALAMGDDPSAADVRAFFEAAFRPADILDAGAPARGFVTGYYEPELPASRTRTARFRVPLYRPPADLVALTDGESVEGLEAGTRFAMRSDDGTLVPYPARAEIEEGWLRGRGLELAFLDSEADAFFVHVQGSARLVLPDGALMRVGYAAKNGHRFTAIGRVLVQEGELPLDGADMAGIRRWLAAHPDRVAALLRRNRSFIFFREIDGADPQAGPIGAQGVALTPLASLAVDAALTPYGTPILLEAPALQVEGAPFRRLVVAQDTGSAIVGSERGDLFVGSGEAAGALAGAIRHAARWTVLRPVEEGAER